eukprot:6191932-Pleurochrysis_carterae.AAC.1
MEGALRGQCEVVDVGCAEIGRFACLAAAPRSVWGSSVDPAFQNPRVAPFRFPTSPRALVRTIARVGHQFLCSRTLLLDFEILFLKLISPFRVQHASLRSVFP